MNEFVVRPRDAGIVLGVTAQQVRNLARTGVLPFRIKRRPRQRVYRFALADLLRIRAQRETREKDLGGRPMKHPRPSAAERERTLVRLMAANGTTVVADELSAFKAAR